jgi:hypothetical protein
LSNKDKHLRSKVFTPEKPLNHSNQQSFRLNYLSEFVSRQIKQNEEINHSIDKVMTIVNTSHQSQEKKIDKIINDQQQQKQQSDSFLVKVDNHEKTTEVIIDSLQHIKTHQEQLNESIQNEKLINQAILDQLNFQDSQIRLTNSQLDIYVLLAQQLSEQLINQEKLLKEMEQKLEVQDVYHSTVMTKLDKQDAMNEKIIRQLDYLKTIIYERANLIAEKVETSIQSTTDYFHELFSKSGFMKPFLLTSRPKEKTEIEEEEKNNVN